MIEERSPECALCNEPGDRAGVRGEYPLVVQQLLEHDCIHFDFPHRYEDENWELKQIIVERMPEPQLVEATKQQVLQRLAGGETLDFFTAGSCTNPTNPVKRVAGYSAVWFQGRTVQDCISADDPLAMFSPICLSQCQGRQTISRAELQIVVLLMEAFSSTRIHTDSKYVIRWGMKLQQCRNAGVYQGEANYDWLHRMHAALHAGTHTLIKVKAHRQFEQCHTPFHKYTYCGNSLADTLANNLTKEYAKRFSEMFAPSPEQVFASDRAGLWHYLMK